MIDSKEESAFENDLLLIFDERTLIENYSVWERLLEILVINSRLDLLVKLVHRIIDAIDRFDTSDIINANSIKTHDALLKTLHSAICRTTALMWGDKINSAINRINKRIEDIEPNNYFSDEVLKDFDYSTVQLLRKSYCDTRMINKYVLPLPVDCVLSAIENLCINNARLFTLEDMNVLLDVHWAENQSGNNQYRYFPYIVSPQELSYALMYTNMCEGKINASPETLFEIVKQLYLKWNYPTVNEHIGSLYNLQKVRVKQIKCIESKRPLFATHIDFAGEGAKICVAVGNARIDEGDFRSCLDRRSNRSYTRYQRFSRIFDAAVTEKVNLLVLPECYLPYEWLPNVSRMCANNQMALVTGLEHVLVHSKNTEHDYVFNLIESTVHEDM